VPAPTISLPQAAGEPTAAERTAIADLGRSVRGRVLVGRHERMLYATDASSYQVEPLAVVIPEDEADATCAVASAAERGLAILPRGGGTSLAGQCVNRAVVVDTSERLRALGAVDAGGRRVRAQAGATLASVNGAADDHGLFFAPDPSTHRQATVGGCIGNNAAGSRSVAYGRMVDHVAAIDACLADGRRVRFERGSTDAAAREIAARVAEVVRAHRGLIRQRFPTTPRRNAGYALDLVLDDVESADADGVDAIERIDLCRLLCGSEGTLAVTLAADLRLTPRPGATGLLLAGFADLDSAIAAVEPLLEHEPRAIELVDDVVMDLALGNREHRASALAMPQPGGEPPKAVLYVELAADGPEALAEALSRAEATVRRVAPTAARRVETSPAAIASAWGLRQAGEPLLHGVPGDRKPVSFVEDNAVPVQRLGEWVRRFREIVARHGTYAAFYAHASVGVLHVRPMLDPRDAGDEGRLKAIAVEVADLARELGGVMSGEHGDGRVRGPLLERFYGRELMAAFAQVKAAFDPAGLLNPGVIVGGPADIDSITQRTRIRPDDDQVQAPDTPTYYRYDDQHGLRGAVEMCNGAGVCRKRDGGVMCPSYMATLDERHSTRGRGNALRLAVTGQLDAKDRWNDAGTLETLNLCLSCKACKSECPSNVDIARLKAEYLAQGGAARPGLSPALLLFGHVRTLGRLGSRTPGLTNLVNATAPARWLLEKLAGVDRRRSLPRFARPLPRRWPRDRAADDANSPPVVVFGDCFSMYNEPEIGTATAVVLRAFGYRPLLADAGCCARPMISTGQLRAAAATVGRTFRKLEHARARAAGAGGDDAGVPVVVLEPSCLSAITDDWTQLNSPVGEPDARRLAAACTSLEAFLHDRWDDHPRRPTLTPPADGVVAHGHCHERAVGPAASGLAMLGRLGEVTPTGATCCGMAGSFGFTTDRYDLSLRIGELGVLPAARAASARGRPVIAAGTSCRHQVLDGAGVHALHPAQWLERCLGEG